MRSHRANEIVNACSLLYVVANTKNESGDIEYQTVLGTRPTGVSELKYNNGTITANITDAAVCTEVKNKLGDKATGECSALTVTLGETTSHGPTDEEVWAYINEYNIQSGANFPDEKKLLFSLV